MCYYDQTRWACGYWKWNHFREQCNKEHRMGETCGLRLVYQTEQKDEVCKLCTDIEKKQRRLTKMNDDVERWQEEGDKPATIERTLADIADITLHIRRMWEEHEYRLRSLAH